VTSLSGHAGAHAVAVAQRYGVTAMFTLSGGHVFPLYDGAVKADPPLRLVDVRHEQTAVFAAEATARLTRGPGLAVVTAGPGVTNSVSAVTGAWFNGAPLVLLGGRAPDYLWGQGALQELDHLGPGKGTRYDEVVRALGGAGELVTDPEELAPALRRAFAADAPYLINVITDVAAAYPRTTTGV
jgi:thiamine pyrophosphate-dependent acetolactate synthase large subunit-like protein